MTVKREVQVENPSVPGFDPTYVLMWAWWVPGEKYWGRSKIGEQSQEDHVKANPSQTIGPISQVWLQTDSEETLSLYLEPH